MNLRKRILLAIVVPLMLSCVLWTVILGQVVQVLSELNRVGQSDRLIACVNATSRLLADREMALLRWMVEDSSDRLRAYHEASTRLDDGLDEMARLVSGDPERLGRLERIRGQSERWARNAGEMIGLRREARGHAPRTDGDLESKRRMDEIRDSLMSFMAAEESLRNQRTVATESRSWTILTAGTGATVFLGIILVISSRRLVMLCGAVEAERAKLESSFEVQERENLSLLSEAMKYYAIFKLDTEGRITSWNQDAERILGYQADEVLSHRPLRFYSSEDIQRDVLYKDMEWADSQGRVEEERWVIRKGGFRFKARVATLANRDANGDLSGYTIVVHEIE